MVNESEKIIIKEFIEWYEWSGHDAFDLFDNTDEIVNEYINYKNNI
jgi:hypothetical protein